MSLVIDIHALQTVPPSLINRDDTGAPKSAIFGGVPRQRISSQAWKRAIRRYFEAEYGAEVVGLRSRQLPELIAKKVMELTPDVSAEDAIAGVTALFKATGTNGIKLVSESKKKSEPDSESSITYPTTAALLFLSPHQIERSAMAVVEKLGSGEAVKFKKNEANDLLDTQHSIDMAMFGRMLADAPNYNVDAAVQVAHAIGVHESEPEFDYYTAVDDVMEDEEETGAGMIGITQMMSSTLYRFATVNLRGLEENLGDEATARDAALKFVTAFIESMPTGKQNTFANNTLPELVYVAVRDTRSVSFVNAFEEPIAPEKGSRRSAAAVALAQEAKDVADVYGLRPAAAFVLGLRDFAEAFNGIAQAVTKDSLETQLCDALAAKAAE